MKNEVEVNATNTLVYDHKQGITTGVTQEYSVTLDKNSNLTVILVWNDAPAAEAAGRALVNDLNLEISGPSLYYTSNDSVNNFEFFEKSALAGSYKVKIIGQQMAPGKSGKQPFSLVIQTR